MRCVCSTALLHFAGIIWLTKVYFGKLFSLIAEIRARLQPSAVRPLCQTLFSSSLESSLACTTQTLSAAFMRGGVIRITPYHYPSADTLSTTSDFLSRFYFYNNAKVLTVSRSRMPYIRVELRRITPSQMK